ncbi:MAG: carbohydrate kinase family protein [Acutalibacteraceae bacterium]
MSYTAVFGVIFVDIKGFPFGKYVPEGRNLGDIRFVHGGVARNVALNFANVGQKVSFVTMTENSAIGAEAVSELEKAGVNLDYIKKTRDSALGMWMVILNESGDVAGQISKMPDITALEELVDEKGDEIVKNCENIVLEMDLGEKISEKVLALAEKYSKKVYVIVGNMSVILKRRDLVKKVDAFICNEIEIGNLLEKDMTILTPGVMAEEIKKASKEQGYPSLVVTMGKSGCAYYDKKSDKCGVCPAHRVPLVDSTGAGDAFLSGTVIGLTKGFDLEYAVRVGTYMASLTVQSDKSACPETEILINSEI